MIWNTQFGSCSVMSFFGSWTVGYLNFGTPGFVTHESDRHKDAPWGVFGGKPGAVGRLETYNVANPSDVTQNPAKFSGLRVEPGRMSLEVHPAGDSSKGTAVRAILDRESAIRSAISVGDDRTDVTVWHMLDTLRAEGRLAGSLSVGVLSAETPPIVTESADTLIEGVAGTERFLAALVADLGRA